MSWRCWYCAWKVMVLSNSATTASKPPSSMHSAGLEGPAQRRRQEAQALQVAAGGQQPPAVVARHPVGLRAGHRGGVAGQRFQHAQRLHRRVVAVFGEDRAAAQELLLGAHDHVPLLLRQALAHGRGRAAQRAAGCSRRWWHSSLSARAGDQRTLEHAARLRSPAARPAAPVRCRRPFRSATPAAAATTGLRR